jgi:NADPH:quinone reductase-like Zn-dependent oxidoreductase
VVRVESVERPVPTDHGVLVKVHASSVNPLDWHYLLGEPYIMRPTAGWGKPNDVFLGTDFAGTVVAVGKLVTKFKVGDEVYGGGDGGMAEYLRIPDSDPVALKPANVSFEEAAAAPVAGITALQALRDLGHVQAGKKVLINGAGGGVGTFAVQIYDVIFDLSGNHQLSEYRRVLTPTGIYILGGDTDKGAWLGPLKSLGKTLIVSKFVKQTMSPFFASLNQADLVALAAMMQAGKIKPVIDRRYSLDQVADAFRYQLTGHARGKVIVTVD